MKKIYTVVFALVLISIKSQVGINTSKPLATFEVHKSAMPNLAEGMIPPRISADSLRMKDHLYGPAQNGAMIFITSTGSKTSQKTKQITSSGYYVYDAGTSSHKKSDGGWKKMFSDPNAFAMSNTSALSSSITQLESSKSNFHAVKLDATEADLIGSEYLEDNQYVVPEIGLYVINYYISLENMNDALMQRPSLAIAKSADKSAKGKMLSTRMLDAFSSSDAKNNSISLVPQASINHIYNLNEGEKINFGLIANGRDFSSFGNVTTEISIYKIR